MTRRLERGLLERASRFARFCQHSLRCLHRARPGARGVVARARRQAGRELSRIRLNDPQQEPHPQRTGGIRIRCRNGLPATYPAARKRGFDSCAQVESEFAAEISPLLFLPRPSPRASTQPNTSNPNSLPKRAASQQPERSGGCGRAPRPKGETRERCVAKKKREAEVVVVRLDRRERRASDAQPRRRAMRSQEEEKEQSEPPLRL